MKTNYIQYMKPGGNFGNKLKSGIKKFINAAGEASRMVKDARINNPGAAMIRDAYAKGDEELAKLLTDEMQAANLTGIALGSGTAPIITGFTVAPATTGATLATGMAGGMAGMYGTDKAINYLSDGQYTGWGDWVNQATNGAIGQNTAGFFHPGAIFGGLVTGKLGNQLFGMTNRGKLELFNAALNKNILATTLQPTVSDEAVLRGQLGWAPKQTIPYRHGSLDPDLKTFVPKNDRWDVVTHGADPNMYFVTELSTPVSVANMMDRRAYQYTGNLIAEKPMILIGEVKPGGVKNNSRNQLIARARQQGADTYIMQNIEDNQVPHLDIVARFIGPEGEAVQGGAASIKWYGPTMGKTTAAKVSDKLVDIDPLLKPIRAKHAERLGLKISDPKVSADPLYKQEVADFVLEWRANPENQGKTLVASTKHLLDPQYKVEFANEPSIPDFETFAARNKARGFKETDEQLRTWYNSILELGRELSIDNRFVSDIEGVTLAHPAISTSTQSTTPDLSYKGQQDLKQMVNNVRQYEALALLTYGYKDHFATFIDDLPNPVKHLSIPTSVKEHIETNVVPRLVLQRPWITSDRVVRDVELNTEGPWYTASRKVFDAAGYEPRVQGIHTSSTGNITIADDTEDMYRFLIHELRHKIDNGVPLTQHEDDLLRAAFGDEFLNIPYAKKNNYDMYNDMVTTIGDARTLLFGLGKGMPIEQLNFFIDLVPDNVIVNAIADSNGYGKELILLLLEKNALTPERIKAFREAMKYVGMVALPLLLSSIDTQNYKSGGKLNYLNLIGNGNRK